MSLCVTETNKKKNKRKSLFIRVKDKGKKQHTYSHLLGYTKDFSPPSLILISIPFN